MILHSFDGRVVAGLHTIAVTGALEPITTRTAAFKKLTLIPGKAVANGLLTPNDHDIYVGLKAVDANGDPLNVTAEKRAPGDVDYPSLLDAPTGLQIPLADVLVSGTAGDGVFFRYIA